MNCATRLEEAWAWGFDVDAWRAHIGPLTWTEVLRQLAIVWGKGPIRPKPRREVRPKMGTDGEDVLPDETGHLRLKLPPRFGIGTVKAAAWAVRHLHHLHPPIPCGPLNVLLLSLLVLKKLLASLQSRFKRHVVIMLSDS